MDGAPSRHARDRAVLFPNRTPDASLPQAGVPAGPSQVRVLRKDSVVKCSLEMPGYPRAGLLTALWSFMLSDVLTPYSRSAAAGRGERSRHFQMIRAESPPRWRSVGALVGPICLCPYRKVGADFLKT